jgi:lysozyme family protein
MTNDAFQTCLEFTLEYEGLYSGVRRDPGNWTGGRVGRGELKGTKYGIAANTYPGLDIEHLTRNAAAQIYLRDFWIKYECDKLLPCKAMVVFDALVNNGPARAKKWQRMSSLAWADSHAFIVNFSAKRLAFDKGLKSLWRNFGKGWQARIMACEAKAIGMLGGSIALKQAAASAHSNASIAKTNLVGSVAVGSTGAASAILLALRAASQSAREKALLAEAKAITPPATSVVEFPPAKSA